MVAVPLAITIHSVAFFLDQNMLPEQCCTTTSKVFFKTGFTQKHNLGVEGGSEKVAYRLSTNLLNQDGIVPQTGYDRFLLRIAEIIK